ncbi:MAG: hypothetical protein JW781_05875 [Deltaproteobacteria bacterium]|nr:hypothetical protein [Candidatus Anaeroferrophillacea bacterium]
MIVYVPDQTEPGKKLMSIVQKAAGEENIHFFRTLASLSRWLRTSRHGNAILVTLPRDERELRWLAELSLESHLDNIRLILVLPKGDDTLMQIGYRMYPRYITTVDHGLEDVGQVLCEMYNTQSAGRPPEIPPAAGIGCREGRQ